MQYKCLSIAGFDGSGGTGIQADIKTFSALGCYGMTVLTALPIQNTCGVKSCYDIPIKIIQEQLFTIFEDIKPDVIKIGMLFSSPIIKTVANFLKKHATEIPIVLDPVMVAKSGDTLLLPEAVAELKNSLIPLATIVTPNLPEAYVLVGNNDEIHGIASKILALGAQAVLLKGGHLDDDISSNDLFLDMNHQMEWLIADRINSRNNQGAGCTLSAAITSFLAHGMSLLDACKYAKCYLSKAMLATAQSSVGKGRGPVNHFYHLWPQLGDFEKIL